MPTTTARAIVTDAFFTLGVFQPGETLPADDAAFALRRLQEMQRSWKLAPLLSPTNVRETFTLVSGKGGPSNPYTIGPTGDWVTTRPLSAAEISGVGLILPQTSPSVEMPRALLTDDAWQAIQVKDLGNAIYTDAYYNATYASDLGTFNVWPVPNAAGYTFVLYRNLPVAAVTNLDASFDLPDGYFEAQSYNLAIRLAAPFAKSAQLTPDVVTLARESLATIKRMNTRLTDLPTDPALTANVRGGYNIQTGTGG